jgi:5,10-methylenetetrahydromethanopterin reductase
LTAPRLGVSLVCAEIREFPAWVRAIEAAGFDAIGFGDSPSLYPETYVQATIVAQNTSRVMFGPRVTNPVTRHPVVTAAAITAADELSGGRAMLGIGVGDSAVHSIGERKATLAELREYVLTLKALFAHGEAEYRGKLIRFPYAQREIPIYLAASGPKGLALAGEIADGVIVGGGIGPELCALARGFIEVGAERAGRSVDDLDVWWLIGASIGDDAVDAIKTHLAAATNACFRGGLEDKGVPEDVKPLLQKLIDGYDFTEHELPGATRTNVRLVEELGLTKYLAERFAVAGTPEEFAERVRVAASWGADALWFTMPLPDKIGFLDAMRDHVVPRLREGVVGN